MAQKRMPPTRGERVVRPAADEDRGLLAALRRPGRPEAGMRVAWPYVVGLLALAGAAGLGVGVVGDLYSSGRLCRADDSVACPLLWSLGVAAASVVALTALGAWFLRLGWRWWVAMVGLTLLLCEVVVDPLSPWLLLLLAVPGVAAVLSDDEIPGRRWRTWVVVAVGVVALGWLLWALSTAW